MLISDLNYRRSRRKAVETPSNSSKSSKSSKHRRSRYDLVRRSIDLTAVSDAQDYDLIAFDIKDNPVISYPESIGSQCWIYHFPRVAQRVFGISFKRPSDPLFNCSRQLRYISDSSSSVEYLISHLYSSSGRSHRGVSLFPPCNLF